MGFVLGFDFELTGHEALLFGIVALMIAHANNIIDEDGRE